MVSNCDVLIAGGGIVGLSVARSLLVLYPKLKVVVVDKELTLGAHASGRNSGVLHAGFYYSPDSLKAKFCKEGNKELRELCERHKINILNTGKIVVAKNDFELGRLEELYKRGLENGVQLDFLDAYKLPEYEPLAQTYRKFLWSPTTAVSKPRSIISALALEFRDLGGTILLGHEVKISPGGVALIGDARMGYKHFVNCAGTQADRIAHKFAVGEEFGMIPFKGIYRAVDKTVLPMRTLVYPVPHPINPFLGVHFTLTMDGKVKIGPTAIPILGREQYSTFKGISFEDLAQTIIGLVALTRGEAHDVSEIVRSEFPKIIEKVLVRESSSLVPKAQDVKSWKSRPPGIRAQLVNLKTGALVQDFIVLSAHQSTHVLNAVSPGWTAAIPFGRWISREKILPFL